MPPCYVSERLYCFFIKCCALCENTKVGNIWSCMGGWWAQNNIDIIIYLGEGNCRPVGREIIKHQHSDYLIDWKHRQRRNIKVANITLIGYNWRFSLRDPIPLTYSDLTGREPVRCCQRTMEGKKCLWSTYSYIRFPNPLAFGSGYLWQLGNLTISGPADDTIREAYISK